MPRRYIGPPPNLRRFVECGLVITTYCDACLTIGREIEPAELAVLLGWHAAKEDIEPRLRCARCGARKGRMQVSTRNVPFTADWRSGPESTR